MSGEPAVFAAAHSRGSVWCSAAGGLLGGAWLVGASHAIVCETGWDPGSADYIVGTSAGSMIGALVACGVPPSFMVAHSARERLEGLTDARGEAAPTADRSAGATFLDRGGALGPGSRRLALASLARPYHSACCTVSRSTWWWRST